MRAIGAALAFSLVLTAAALAAAAWLFGEPTLLLCAGLAVLPPALDPAVRLKEWLLRKRYAR